MIFDVETLRRQIPDYLAESDKTSLVNNLKAIADGDSAEFFLDSRTDPFKAEILQGDGWTGLEMFEFSSGMRRCVRGIVLSNSCDIDRLNPRQVPSRLVFAPLVRLSAFIEVLRASGFSAERVESKVNAIRSQATTNMFYLPPTAGSGEEQIVRLDEVHSLPMQHYLAQTEKTKIFTLNMTGFYMLVLKLSIHFCRMQEHVERRDPTNA